MTLLDRVHGRQFDTGPFRRQVRLTASDPAVDPLLVTIVGSVEGDVQVGGPEDNGRISLGTFDRTVGSKRSLTLSTELPNVQLAIDRTTLPEYLQATLSDKPVLRAGHWTWRLEVAVKPEAANGIFPRDDAPAYRDSAVYVKVHGDNPRTLRIPVEGNAENR